VFEMAVKTYSLAKDGDKRLSANFRVREFRCKDGTDKILVSTELVEMLEKLRAKLAEKLGGEVSININSGYRTKAHNKKIGGSTTSKHCKGLAADIICKKDGKVVPAKEVCTAAQDIDFDGIAYISGTATHVDCRGYRWWSDETKGNKKVADFYAYYGMAYPEPTETVKKGDKGTPVRWVQDKLKKAGYNLAVDGKFGGGTDRALRAFQKKKVPPADGKCGRNTRNALKKY
jgi:hypothetical protein